MVQIIDMMFVFWWSILMYVVEPIKIDVFNNLKQNNDTNIQDQDL